MESGRPVGSYCSRSVWRWGGWDNNGVSGGCGKRRSSGCILRRVELTRILSEMSVGPKVLKLLVKRQTPNLKFTCEAQSVSYGIF